MDNSDNSVDQNTADAAAGNADSANNANEAQSNADILAAQAEAAQTGNDNTDEHEYRRADDTFDVFHWANEVDEVKNNVSVELFQSSFLLFPFDGVG